MLHPLPDPATDAAAVSSAHYCRGCGKRWLMLHRLDCPLRDPYRVGLQYVLAHHCAVHELWPLDRQQRTAPHGDLR